MSDTNDRDGNACQPSEVDPSEAAKALGRLGGLKGGPARAEKLTSARKSEIAKVGATARWAKRGGEPNVPAVTHGDENHPLRIGSVEIPCYVLEDGRRVLAQNGMLTALKMSPGSAGGEGRDRLTSFAAGKAINPFISNELRERMANPILFRTPGGRTALGYEATILADLCDAVLVARESGALRRHQFHIARQCEILIRGFARVGIIALVDEVTGYQADRDRNELRRILEAYISAELLPWTERFPKDFYQEMFRLNKWQYNPLSSKRPMPVGRYTVELVYDKLPPGVLEELRSKNPVVYKGGRRKHRHHQFLTEEIGNPHLEKQVVSVTALMRASSTWQGFKKLFVRAFPPREQQQSFLPDESDHEES